MPERPSIMDLPRQVAAAVRARLPINGRGKVSLPVPLDSVGRVKRPRRPARAQLAAKRLAHVAACNAHIALYPKFPCVICATTEAVSAFILRRPEVGTLPLAIPLCFSCSEPMKKLHPDDRLVSFRRHGVDALLLAQALRNWSGELRRMDVALAAHARQALQERDTLRVQLR